MKKIMRILQWISIVFMIILIGWGDKIEQFNLFIYYLMAIVVFISMAFTIWKSQHERDQAIANRAVTEYKKEQNIHE